MPWLEISISQISKIFRFPRNPRFLAFHPGIKWHIRGRMLGYISKRNFAIDPCLLWELKAVGLAESEGSPWGRSLRSVGEGQ